MLPKMPKISQVQPFMAPRFSTCAGTYNIVKYLTVAFDRHFIFHTRASRAFGAADSKQDRRFRRRPTLEWMFNQEEKQCQ